jgi:hypothetical protein
VEDNWLQNMHYWHNYKSINETPRYFVNNEKFLTLVWRNTGVYSCD